MEDLDAGRRPPDANPASVGIVYLVSAFPDTERDKLENANNRIRQYFQDTRVVPVLLPGILMPADLSSHTAAAENAVSSFVAAVQLSSGQGRLPDQAAASV
jgi:hypothetical protein